VLNDTYPTGLNSETHYFTYCYAEYNFPVVIWIVVMLSVISLTVMAPDTALFQELVKEINIKIQPHPTLEHFLQKKKNILL
jgi:hypothetical protein